MAEHAHHAFEHVDASWPSDNEVIYEHHGQNFVLYVSCV